MRLRTEEELFLRELVAWDMHRLPVERFLALASLVCGGGLIGWVALFTLSHLSDTTAFWVTIPGFLAGLFLVGVYVLTRARIEQRHRIVSILRKLRAH